MRSTNFNISSMNLIHISIPTSPLHERNQAKAEKKIGKNSHNRQTNHHHSPPLRHIKGHDREQRLQERGIEQREMQHHGQRDGVDEDHVIPQREREQGFAGGEGVHGVEHLDDDEDGEGDSGGCFGAVVGEDLAAQVWELGGAGVEV